MTLDTGVRRQVARKLETYEGRVDHFYLDSVGKVTVGVGHLIVDREAVADLAMETRIAGQPPATATLAQKRDEYDRIEAEAVGYRAGWYAQVAQLRMPDDEINRLRDHHIGRFHRELQGIYTRARGYPQEFDNLPKAVQLALFDLIFNLGATRLVNIFRRLDSAVRAADWKRAALESYRPQVSHARNQYVHQLFMSAAQANEACVPTC